jgi:dehydrogenase/reductase SDR family member 1
MGSLTGKVALVTGASRGVGKGIALVLGEAGATVYVTGRTTDEAQPTVPLAGTIHQTAEAITQSGGKGIAVRCDHRDDAQVEALFARIQQEQGRLDVLVNNAWGGYEGYHTGTHLGPMDPFWIKPLSYWEDNLAGVRWAYAAGRLAAPMMIAQGSGLIVNISFGVPEAGNAAYGIAKMATDRLSWEMAHQLRPHGVAAVSLYPGLVRTEGVLKAAEYFDMSNAESPQFTGRAVLVLATDPSVLDRSGQVWVVAKLAQEYDFNDIDGTRPRPI